MLIQRRDSVGMIALVALAAIALVQQTGCIPKVEGSYETEAWCVGVHTTGPDWEPDWTRPTQYLINHWTGDPIEPLEPVWNHGCMGGEHFDGPFLPVTGTQDDSDTVFLTMDPVVLLDALAPEAAAAYESLREEYQTMRLEDFPWLPLLDDTFPPLDDVVDSTLSGPRGNAKMVLRGVVQADVPDGEIDYVVSMIPPEDRDGVRNSLEEKADEVEAMYMNCRLALVAKDTDGDAIVDEMDQFREYDAPYPMLAEWLPGVFATIWLNDGIPNNDYPATPVATNSYCHVCRGPGCEVETVYWTNINMRK